MYRQFIQIIKFLRKYALYIAFTQALVATLGSLYFSEIQKLQPCLLCWYQRILMYPLVIILGIAIARRDKSIAYYVLPLSVLGSLIGFYQYLLQMTVLKEVTPISCSALSSCSAIDLIYFGFITIPFLSMMGFLLISAMMIIIIKGKNK